jgi:hypothetical protein
MLSVLHLILQTYTFGLLMTRYKFCIATRLVYLMSLLITTSFLSSRSNPVLETANFVLVAVHGGEVPTPPPEPRTHHSSMFSWFLYNDVGLFMFSFVLKSILVISPQNNEPQTHCNFPSTHFSCNLAIALLSRVGVSFLCTNICHKLLLFFLQLHFYTKLLKPPRMFWRFPGIFLY